MGSITPLSIFSVLTKDTISKIMNLLDENLVKDQRLTPKSDEIKKLGFTDAQLDDILECFFNFYVNIDNSDTIVGLINSSNIPENAKHLAKETFDEIKKRADKDKISTLENVTTLEDFGHPHLRNLTVVTEFRPLSKDGKIIKIVPSLVLAGETHTYREKSHELNFQMNIKAAEMLIKALTEEVQTLKNEIAIFKKQFGENIVVE